MELPLGNSSHNLDMDSTESSVLPAVGLAIFGLGKIGSLHYVNLRMNLRAKILYLVEEFDDVVNTMQYRWKIKETGVKFLKPSEEDIVFSDSKVDAILVCTPASTHEHIVTKALENGKAVFCEKPLSLNEESVRKCLAASKKNSKPLLCGFNRRFDPGLVSLKSRVDDGEVGQLRVVRMVSRDPPHTKKEYVKITGGIFHDSAIHDIDYICWVMGQYPESLTTYAHTFNEEIIDEDNYDTIIILMKFPNGAAGEVEISRHAKYGYDQRVEVFGSEGMLTCGGARPTTLKQHQTNGTTAVPIYFNFAERYKESYIEEMEHFLNVVQGLEACKVPVEAILASTMIATASKGAAKERKFVDLTWDGLKMI